MTGIEPVVGIELRDDADDVEDALADAFASHFDSQPLRQ
jgi:hypothetical protein